MANGVQLPVSVVDNTKQGLSSAFNNTTKMTAQMAKKLVLEVKVAFPSIAAKTKDLQSQLSSAFRDMGKIDFIGERLGKKGNVLGMLGFDGKALRKDMSLDAVKQHLDRLKTIQSKLKDNSLVSGNTGDAFKKEQKYIANAVRSLEAYKNTLELIFRTNAKFNTQLTTNASRLNDQAKSAKRAANETARAYQQSYAAIDRARNRFSRGGNSSKELADMRRYYQQQEQAARRAATETRKLENSLTRQGTLLGRLKSLASRYFSVYTVINFGKKVAEVTGYFQQQQVALEGILGSASEAKKLLNEITSFALTSPFQTKELVQFTKQLAAFGVKEDLFEKVKELADISTGLGVGMDRIILAYGQVKSATVLRGQELRQFTEAGIPMVEALAKKFTALNGEVVRTSEIFEMISKRQVSFDVVAEVLSDMTKEGGQFYKMQENITNTMYGQMQKLRDLWTLAMNDIGKTSGGVLNTIIKLLQQMVIHGKSIAIAIGAAFAGNAITKAIVGYKLLNDKVKAYIRLLRMSTKARMLAFGGAAGVAIGVVVGLISKAVIEANKLRKAFEEIEDSFEKENSRMLEGLDSLTRKITSAKLGTKEYAEAVDTLAQNYGDFISNDLIKKLKDQEGAAYDTARAFGEIAENVKEAIAQYNEYKEIKEKENVIEDSFFNKKMRRDFLSAIEPYGYMRYRMLSDAKDRYGDDFSFYDLNNKIGDLFEKSIRNFSSKGEFTKQSFEKSIKEVFSNQFPTITDEELKTIIQIGWEKSIQKNNRAKEAIREYNMLLADEKKTGYYEMFRYFNSVDPSKSAYNSPDKIAYQNNREAVYIDALYNTISDKFKLLIPSINKEISEEQREGYKNFAEQFFGVTDSEKINPIIERMIERYTEEDDVADTDRLNYLNNVLAEYIENGGNDTEYIKQLEKQILSLELLAKLAESYTKEDGLIKTLEFNNNTVSEINNLLSKFRETFGNDSELNNWLSQVQQEFNKHVETKTGRAAEVSELMENNVFYRFTVTDEAVKALWMQLIPDDLNYEEKRKSVSTQLSEKKSELENYRKRTDKDEKHIQSLELQIQALELLASADYYNIKTKEETKAGNRYERIRSTDLLTKMLSLIKKAEDATKKIVGVTGYTEQLNEFVGGLEEGNFLKEFFVEGGNPFKAMLEELKKEGVTQYLPDIDEEKLKTIFRQAGWEEGKEMSIPDFQAMYKQAIEVLGAELLADLKAKHASTTDINERNSLSAEIQKLQNTIISQTNEMKTRWGGDEIEKKINLAIKELTNIGSKLDDIKSQRRTYERIAKSSNPLIAKKALSNANVSGYFSDSRYTSAALREMLRTEGGAGIASTLVGERLKSLLNGGSLNIDNLSALFEIIRDLEEQAGEKEITLADGSKIANSDQFKETTSKVVDIINKLVESILNEYDKLAQYKTGDLKISDEILQAAEDFKNALKEIEETEKDPNRAASMKLSATQQYYDKLLKSLGGSEMPDWIKTMFGKEDAFGGISNSGRFMKNISGGSSLLDMIVQGKASNINKLYQAGKFGDVGTSKAMQGAADALASAASNAAGSIAMVDAIIKAVYQAINAVVELGKGVLEVDAKVNNKLKLRKGANGKLYDKDGNINIGDNYYKKQDRREIANQALDIIGNFNNHIMGGWEKLKSGDIFGAITETAMSIADLIGDIVGVGDTKLRQQQDELIRSNDRLVNAMNSLEHALSLSVGNEKYDIYKEQASKLREQQLLYEQLLALENQKKNGDDEKAQDYASQAKEAGEQLDTLLNDFKTEVLGTADELANTLTDALVGAFREGTNAARAWRDAVRSYIGDVLKQELMTKIITPQIDEIMDSFFGSEALSSDEVKDLFSNEDNVLAFVDALNQQGTNLIDIFENIPQSLKDLIAFNGDTSALYGGISGITEDTARTLEGLANSMLMQMILANRELSTISQSGFAQVQVSWFNDMLYNTRLIAENTEGIKTMISDSILGTKKVKVEMS